jgi:hypothetical protein
MCRNLLLGFLIIGTVLLSDSPAAAGPYPDTNNGQTAQAKFSETETYMDLNTGKWFKVIYDGLNDTYNREDLFAFDLFVNLRTKDTFWLDLAVPVNNALVRDAAGSYRVDPMKVKRDGNGYRVINNKTVKKEEGAAAQKQVIADKPVVPENPAVSGNTPVAADRPAMAEKAPAIEMPAPSEKSVEAVMPNNSDAREHPVRATPVSE